jgi:cell division protein FtsL
MNISCGVSKMLAAQKGSNAYQYQQQEYYTREQQQELNQYPKVKSKTKVKKISKLKMILSVLICFSIAFGIMLRYVAITEANNKVSSYKRQLSQLQRANEQMQVELDRSIDLKKVEEIAKSKLGMRRPEKYQMVYVELKKNDYAEIVNEQAHDSGRHGNFANILGVIHNVLEYLY